MADHRYKTAHFEGYFLGARAVLDIFFEFAPVMESGKKNEGAILHLLMQFNINNLMLQDRFQRVCLGCNIPPGEKCWGAGTIQDFHSNLIYVYV